ncbi:hypothetical protein JXL19_09190 [bacterium]|nr:hypothetical protein [bacterium]
MIGGPIQVIAAVTAASLIPRALGLSWRESIFLGFLISLSSTAILLKLFHESAMVYPKRSGKAVPIQSLQKAPCKKNQDHLNRLSN